MSFIIGKPGTPGQLLFNPVDFCKHFGVQPYELYTHMSKSNSREELRLLYDNINIDNLLYAETIHKIIN